MPISMRIKATLVLVMTCSSSTCQPGSKVSTARPSVSRTTLRAPSVTVRPSASASNCETLSATKSTTCRSAASRAGRSEEHTSELQSLMRISYAVFCLKKKKVTHVDNTTVHKHINQINNEDLHT